MADALADLAEAADLLDNVAHRLRERGRSGDAGSLLMVGRSLARLKAGRALVRTGEAEAAAAFAIALLLDIGRAFPVGGSRAPRDEDETVHLRFEAIGRHALAEGAAL
ncbi:MAG: hypothetical protein ABW173_07345 [Sphingomonas sp.]